VTWFNKRYGHIQDNKDWVKMHLMVGVSTNVVTAVEITGGHASDMPQLPALVESTVRNFRMSEVSADKGYSSIKNLRVIAGNGAVPYVPFKVHTTGAGKGSDIWGRMWHLYNFRREEFLAHYHKRSNVETTFSMIKAKFGGRIRSKSPTGIVNEALAKVLCHNLCVVIQSIHELGLTPTFWTESAVVPKLL